MPPRQGERVWTFSPACEKTDLTKTNILKKIIGFDYLYKILWFNVVIHNPLFF